MLIKKILTYSCIIIAFILIISLYGLIISIFPRRYISTTKPSDLGLKYEEITLTTSDNINLKAWFIPNNKSKSAIIVCHGYPFDKGNVLGFAPFLHKHHSLLFFDFRAMGESGGKYTTAGYKEVGDLRAAIKHLKSRNIKNIGAIGFSLGAATILMTSSDDIKAIVADSSYANLNLMIDALYRQFFLLKYPFTITTKLLAKLFLKIDTSKVSPENTIKNTTAQVLLIHGEKDSQIPLENSQRLHNSNPKTELWIVEDADHGQAHAIKTAEYEKRVLDFFDKHLDK